MTETTQSHQRDRQRPSQDLVKVNKDWTTIRFQTILPSRPTHRSPIPAQPLPGVSQRLLHGSQWYLLSSFNRQHSVKAATDHMQAKGMTASQENFIHKATASVCMADHCLPRPATLDHSPCQREVTGEPGGLYWCCGLIVKCPPQACVFGHLGSQVVVLPGKNLPEMGVLLEEVGHWGWAWRF